jgi:iron complex transport system ATP-binding protein
MLTVSGIHFSYNSHPALSDIHFSLDAGQILGVLGVNGAGKSTLLKCLNRILRPQIGAVLLEKTDILQMNQRDVARRMGYVSQRHAETRLSVYEAILLGRRPHMGWTVRPKDYQVVETLLAEMALTHLSHRPVCDLSGGEVQQVMIARALAQSPRVLLLDEPTSNLDIKHQLEVMKTIRHVVREQQLSAVVSIHDLNLAVRFADAFLFIKDHCVYALHAKNALNAATISNVYGVEVSLINAGDHLLVVPH